MKRFITLVLALAMMLCAASFAAAEENVTHLVTISAGSKPAGYDDVIEAANAYSAEKYGITIEIRFLDWDPSSTYPIIMNTGDGVDMVWYSSWPGSQNYAREGAFVELEEYLEKPEYADLKAAISEQAWNDVKINGHIYCIPAPEVTYNANMGIIYRSDLCEKYDLPVPDTAENAIAYLEGVKANEPDVYPLSSSFGFVQNFACLEQIIRVPGSNAYGLRLMGEEGTLTDYYTSDLILDDLKLIRQFVDEGIVSRDLQNDPLSTNDKFAAGTAMMVFGHVDTYGGVVSVIEDAKADDPEKADWSVGYVPFNVNLGYVQMDSATEHNATGIAYMYSDNIEASLTYIQAVLTDPTLHHLIRYGIEGVHYELDENGAYVNISSDFTSCGLSTWNWRSDALSLETSTGAVGEAKQAVLDQYEAATPLVCGFSFDTTNVKDEVSNYNAVYEEYGKPLMYGLVEDVEAGLATFLEKAEAAGLATIQEEYTRQYNEWLDAQNAQ